MRHPAVLGPTIAESTPAFDPLPHPPADAPNVVVIVLDDLGFAQLGCFGGDVDTPNIDALAERGLRYNNFHVTAMCSPTRGALLTGRNQHAVGMGFVTDVPIGFPGYNARIPASAAALPRHLRDAGYATFHVGKWHLAPRWEQSAAGPFTRWPLGLGFQRSYGFLAGDTNQFAPDLIRDNGLVDAPRTPAEGYHLTQDLVDQAQRMILDQQQAAPNMPFCVYFATGAMHAPHQAPPEWIERFAGRYDAGWDAWRADAVERQRSLGIIPEHTDVPDRPPWVPAWSELDDQQRRIFARQMEVFAGFLAHTDHQIGRLLEFLDEQGLRDDTVVMLISDNGTSGEGGPHGSFNEHRFVADILDDLDELEGQLDDLGGHRSYGHYSWGWAWAGNTPFRLWKRYAWLGGVRTPLIVSWPGGIEAAGEIRNQFVHAIDLTPTLLDIIGIDPPDVVDGVTQQPMHGRSIRATFDDPDASTRSTQYFEIIGSRAIVADGWKATTDHVGRQLVVETKAMGGHHDFADDRWALFDLAADPAECHDLAEQHPERADQLERLWWGEAGKYNVLPLDDGFLSRAVALEPSPFGLRPTGRFGPGGGPVHEDVLPPMGGGFTLTAALHLDGGTSPTGVIAALGDWSNGWALALIDGVPHFGISLFGDPVIATGPPVAGLTGDVEVTVTYVRSGDERVVTVGVGGETGESISIARDLPFRWQIGGAGLLIGHDVGFPVWEGYSVPGHCSVTIDAVRIDSTALMAWMRPDEIRVALHRE